MSSTSLASVVIAPGESEVREFPIPSIATDAGLLKVEINGICGTDVRDYRRTDLPIRIMGHEIIGHIETLGSMAAGHWGAEEGDRVLLEEYLPCGHCAKCRSGQFRVCSDTDILKSSHALRYGATSLAIAPGLWGGLSEYVYLHPRTVMHRVSDDVPAHELSLALPLSNGYEWVCVAGACSAGDTVTIIGPGQQGLGCVVAAKAAGATTIIVAGRHSDEQRLKIAQGLGATHTVDVESEPLADVVTDVTAGQMSRIVLDCAASNQETLSMALEVLAMSGTLVVGARNDNEVTLPFRNVREKMATLRGVRGHSYGAVEWAINFIQSGFDGASLISSGQLKLNQVGEAIELTRSGEAVHVTVLPSL